MLHFLRSIGFVIAAAALLPATHAQAQLAAGRKLDAAQIQSLGPLESVEIDGQNYRLLKTQDTAGPAVTFLLNAESMVGQSTHQVVVTRQPVEAVRQYLRTQTSGFAEATYYDHMQITLLSFATLQQAVQGLAQIRAALPEARVQLPIRFGNENLR